MFYLTYVFLQHVLLTRFWTVSVVIVWIKLIVMSPCRTGFHINGPKNGGQILQVLQWVVFSLSLLSCALIFICMENILWFREFTEPITFYLSDQQ